MKLGLSKPGAKKTMRVAAAFTGMTAAAVGFAPAAAAKGPTQSNSTRGRVVNPDTAAGSWTLDVFTNFHHVFACEYYAGRTGHSCSALYVPNGAASTARSFESKGVFAFRGHIALIWSWASAKPSFTITGPGPTHLKVQQYTVTALPGTWNQCSLPKNNNVNPGTYNVFGYNGVANCLNTS
jgi:hypothetical protein